MNRHLTMLWLLYFVQGLPFGFQATALPVLFREGKASLTLISLVGLVSVPWVLKPLWAPFVDRSATRKAWIVPMQGLLAIAVLGAAAVGDQRLYLLLGAVAVINLCAATLDIAVDGLAVDVLGEQELGMRNAAQVVGYKLGMIVGGGLLLFVSHRLGHAASLSLVAALIVAAMAVTWRFDEPPRMITDASSKDTKRPSYGQAWKRLLATLRSPTTRWVAAAAITYKAGEAMADTMFKPFVVDAGFTRDQIGIWIGTWGMVCSLIGSFGSGWLASRTSLGSRVRWSLWHTLALAAALRVLPLVGQWWLAAGPPPSATPLIAITCAEHLFGGALTTAMFATMMASVDRRIGATHFTVLAALEVVGKGLCGAISGPITERLGYATTFGIAVTLSAAFLLLLPALRRPAMAH